jgi:uncharacterized protein with HEPN domain
VTRSWQVYARHVLDAVEKIRRIQERGDLTRDEVLYDACLRNLQTLSEATQHLPEDIRRRYPSIPWKQISGFRNILVHNYLGNIDAQTVLDVIRNYLPPLQLAVCAMLDVAGSGTE